MTSRPGLSRNVANAPLSVVARAEFTPQAPSSTAPSDDAGPSVPYVTDVVTFSATYAAAGSDSRIVFYDRATLQPVREIRPDGKAALKSISGSSNGSEEALIATYEDGRVGIFDARASGSEPQLVLKGPQPAPCLCASTNSTNTYLASGTELHHHEATVRIHDLRAPSKPLHIYVEAHSDDVSTLAFHPTIEHLLATGAMDGLANTIDVRIADEDDAILHTANVGASLSRVGWMNLPASAENWQGVFALTNMETLSLFDAADEMSIVKQHGDVREIECPDWQTHYAIDCQGTEGGLALFTGQREGAAAIIQAPFDGDWTVEQTLRHFRGHTDIVRGCRMDMGQGAVVSCGEDGLVCLWSAANSQAASADASGSATAIPSSESASSASKPLKASTGKETKAARYAPY